MTAFQNPMSGSTMLEAYVNGTETSEGYISEYTRLIEEGTQVMSSEQKKSSATLVYPQAAAFAFKAACLRRRCIDGVGGPSTLGLIGADAMVTVY